MVKEILILGLAIPGRLGFGSEYIFLKKQYLVISDWLIMNE
jgi:hypothetical protein